MKKTIVFNRTIIDLGDVIDVQEIEHEKTNFLNREAGFIIYMKDNKKHVFGQPIPYDSFPHEISNIKALWTKARDEFYQKWEAYKSGGTAGLRILEGFTQLSREHFDFVDTYIHKILYFREAVKFYPHRQDPKHATEIRNADLWVDAFIGKYPQIQEFRDEIERAMKELDIVKYSEEVYATANHFRT